VQRTLATTADNIELIISATVTWRIVDVLKAAVNAESTMAISGKLADASVQLGFNDNLGTDLIASLKDDLTDGRITQEEYHALLEEAMRGSTESVYSDRSKVTASNTSRRGGGGGGAAGRKGKKGPGGGGGGGSEGGAGGDEVSGLSKIRHDVLRQCLASLAGFVGGVRFSTTFGLSAANHSTGGSGSGGNRGEDNPMQNKERLLTAVHHANTVTMKYGVEVININIIEASPLDDELSTALASGEGIKKTG
jgi:regulator of protease activity HflC (stomatin/prohibitin superfamily)